MKNSETFEEFKALVSFAKKSRVAAGFATMAADGSIDEAGGLQLYINCRMTHIFCLASMLGDTSARDYAHHGITSLLTSFRDVEYGGFFSQLTVDGVPVSDSGTRKEAYAHAFVMLAASSGIHMGIPQAKELFEYAAQAHNDYFWETSHGLVREAWNREFSVTDAYRGINANMHTVEALLAAWDATGNPTWIERAGTIVNFVVRRAPELGYRVGEHYSADWIFLPDFNKDRPADPFRPYGVTPGHGFEWARLILQYWAAVERIPEPNRPSCTDDIFSELPQHALNLFNQAWEDGWNADGAPGIIYTTDFSGTPIVHERMHWTACEAMAAASAFEFFYAQDDAALAQHIHERWNEVYQYVRAYVIEAPGRWIHELDRTNAPSGVTWPGKPDVYHAAQAMLMPHLPLTPCFAGACAVSS